MTGGELARRTRRRLTPVGGLGNGIGASVVIAFILFLSPGAVSEEQYDESVRENLPLFIAYMVIVLPLGGWWIQFRPFAPIARWLEDERPASDDERELVLRYPRDWAWKVTIPWAVGALIFIVVNLDELGLDLALTGAATIVLGGVTACALQYLLVERILRPITALALAGGPPPRLAAPGVATRLTMAWTVATGVPLLGIMAIAVAEVAGADLAEEEIIGAVLFLSALALALGLAAILFAARSVADPLAAMRGALAQVERGELEVRVPVDDGSEVGLMQAGFNRMAAGLAERERLRDAFGTFVDPSLAERVLEEGTDLAGEEVELSLLFVDVRGFTSFSERAEATEVVATLNDLYGQIVPIILRHGGHANKFIGDGLLAIFGAPERYEDHADRAVAAGAEIAATVAGRYGRELRVGIGVNSGTVVVGTIGGGGRLDFTVIGDAVNTASRVESATRETGDDLLITDATHRLLRTGAGDWVERPAIPLKGKTETVRLFAPANAARPAS